MTVKGILWEWDMLNGEYIYKEEIEADTEEELYKILEEEIKNAEENYGWQCEETGNGDYICTKQDEDGYPIEHQIGIDII